MNNLVEQVLKIRSEFSHNRSKLSVKEVIKLDPLDYVYQDKKRDLVQSRVIERILTGLELPPLYLTRQLIDIDVFRGDELIIPTLRFRSDRLRLEALEVLTELEGLTYSKLPVELQDMFLSYEFDVLEFPLDIELDHIGYLGLHYDDR